MSERSVLSRRLWLNREFFVLESDGKPPTAGESPDQLSVVDPAILRQPPLVPCTPTKIVCIGLNYRRHAEEMGKSIPELPVVFLKPTTALIAHQESIVLPVHSNEVHYEGELAAVVGTRASHVSEHDAMAHVAGFTVLNDVTARDLQRQDGRYTRAKGFDTFAPVGPVIATGLDPRALSIETRVNGDLRQQSGCDDMIFSVPWLISYVSSIMTLMPGDILTTGTPSGVGPLKVGDVVSVSINDIGTLTNPVAGPVAP
jgi:2-keto-4-pentenoate hydratase/2-oxohepta-3-ene-1,7-dioic acid hydratase in catechol pathway